MNTQYFFMHKDQLEAMGADVGFDLYCAGHLVWLCAIAAAGTVISGAYKKAGKRRREKTAGIFAVTILVSEILKDIILVANGASIIDYMPLHLCSFAIICMMAHAFCRSGRVKEAAGQMMAYAFFPGATAALLFCNWTLYPFFSFMNIFSFLFHGWIIFYFLMIYRAKEVIPSYRGMWQTALAVAVAAVPVYIFNLIFDTNYLFINEASEGSPLVAVWNIFGERFGQGGYLFGVALLVIAVFHGLFLVYTLLRRCYKH